MKNKTPPPIYPLVDNQKWYAENGTVYNEIEDSVRIVILHDSGSYTSLPHDIAELIADALNNPKTTTW